MEMKPDKTYQAESDCDALVRAEEIKADEGRHKAAMAVMEKRSKNMESAMMSDGMKQRMSRRRMM